MALNPGDIVRVRSIEEIKFSLDMNGQLKGCIFTEEMLRYCDTTQRILKKVEKFLDERNYLIKKCEPMFILDGIMCHGSKALGSCDRSCFFFWREEWIEKIE